ncbi:hypothetical protein H310_11898 [Aphanomyces invadans]|uniref:Uncharacterized protein n=1 Tax=Aphanomyces invadans TaxID=157072 RepID=A0A024TLF3_9STRA|nr:hypothetical protein H310_11898 [Aphanomyces invadans]ETV94192.1 hypothetical protein H310_11898 [Aphanomyces invadans]|eukprot:XP_008876955.1 hypothetical protein H310_11898 [Aphanomyces invadans]
MAIVELWAAYNCGTKPSGRPPPSLDGLRDAGLLLSTQHLAPDAHAKRIVDGVNYLLDHVQQHVNDPSPSLVQLLDLVRAVFDGLKATKQFAALDTTCNDLLPVLLSLVDVLFSRRKPPADGKLHSAVLKFTMDVLLGYQHSSALYLGGRDRLLTHLETVEQWLQAPDHAPDDRAFLGRTLVLTVCGLARLHPSCKHLNVALSKLVANLGLHHPTASEIDHAIRQASWVVPSEAIRNDCIPTVEGLWTLDENSIADAHTSSRTNRNAGSVVLRQVSACHGVSFAATVHDSYNSDKMLLELTGDVVSELESCELRRFQGQWQYVLDANAPNTMQAPLQEWSCPVCTVTNSSSAHVCTTCGATAPTVEGLGNSPPSASNRSNPAPFSAKLQSNDATFMDVLWSRGEQHGKWLARRERQQSAFDLRMSADVDLRASVYTPRGVASDCLIVEKSNLQSNFPTSTIEFWTCLPHVLRPCHQVVMSNGEFTVGITPQGHLVWQVGPTELTARDFASAALTSFIHVALVWHAQSYCLVVNGQVASQVPRRPGHTPAKVLVLGGAPTAPIATSIGLLNLPRVVYGVDSCFQGNLVELRMWSAAMNVETLAQRSRVALHGDEADLVAYFPLVGDTLHRDFTRHGNHASWLDEYHRIESASSATLPISAVDLANLPSQGHRWRSTHGFSFFGHVVPAHDHLELHSGSAVWFEESVNLSSHAGFHTDLVLSSAQPSSSVCVAWSSVSFWDLKPFIDEATLIHTHAVPGRAAQRALFVQVSTSSSSPSNTPNTTVGVFVWANKALHCLSVVHTVASRSIDPPTIRLAYTGTTLSALLNNRLVSVLSLDLRAVLGSDLKRTRVGLVSPHELNATLSLASWSFSVEPPHDTPGHVSAIRAVYGLDPPAVDDADASTEEDIVRCTKHLTDGSAIIQELYMCQTCNSNLVFCVPCASICHQGHELVWMGKVNGACGCHTRGPETCQCYAVPASARGSPDFNLWRCPQCTVVNATSVSICSVCSCKSPLPSTMPSSPLHPAGLVPVAEATGEWSCPACTMLNEWTWSKCSICDTARPVGTSPLPTSASPTNDGILSLYHAAAEVAGPWACGACTMHNQASDVKCSTCGTMKPVPLAMPVAIPVPTTPTMPDQTVTMVSQALDQHAAHWLDKKRELLEHKKRLLPAHSLGGLQVEVWETSQGVMTVHFGDHFVGDIVHGQYTETSDGAVSGVLKTLDHRLELRGTYKPNATAQDNACVLVWTSLRQFEGYWYRGDGTGIWKCEYTPLTTQIRGLRAEDVPFHSGLVNMQQGLTNVCYQNSFLQILFMTHALRDQVLASPEPVPNATLQTLQVLFARMLVTHAPSLATHDLQKVLPTTFQAGRQQDVCDFAHFLVESISAGFDDAIHRLLGGTQATIVACKAPDCNHVSVTTEYFWELLLNMVDLRYTPITNICGVHGTSLRIPTPRNFDRLNYDLNKDRTGAPYVFLCVQRDERATPITDITVKVCDANDPKPTLSGYTRVELDLNMGTSTNSRGGNASPFKNAASGAATTETIPGRKKQVYLFYASDPTGSPITDLTVIYGHDAVPDGFKVIRVDLNQGEGAKVFLCYRCDMPVTDIKLVTQGLPGYKMIDRSLQLAEGHGSQYLAHTDGGTGPCITGLRLVPEEDVAAYETAAWEDLKLSWSSPLAETCPSTPQKQHLMLQRGHGNPLYAIEVFRSPQMVPKYSDYETISVLAPPPVAELTPDLLLGEWNGGDDVDRAFRAVKFTHTAPNLSPSYVVSGAFGKNHGRITGIVQSHHVHTHVLWGSWTDSTIKTPQLVHLVFRDMNPTGGGATILVDGVVGDGKAKLVNFRATQVSNQVAPILRPITDLLIARGEEARALPPGASILCCLHSDLFLVVRRDHGAAPVQDVCVVYGGIDPIPDDYTCMDATVGGASANLNPTSKDVCIFICFKRDDAAPGLSDIVVLTTPTVPVGYTKLQHTPLGMDASLVQNKAIHLAIKRMDTSAPTCVVDHALNGQYDTSLWGRMNVTVLESVRSTELLGNLYVTAAGMSSGAGASGVVRGVVYPVGTKLRCVGLWEAAPGHSLLSYNKTVAATSGVSVFGFDFSLHGDRGIDGGIPVADGWWSRQGAETGKWTLIKDCYVQVAYKKDYGSEWLDGKLISSERVSKHSVASLLHRFGSAKTLGGDFTCSGCHQRAESRVHSVVMTPPAHLILTFKRMHYDWKVQKTCKSLHDVSFPAFMTLPPLSPEDATTLSDADTPFETSPRAYGLYGVLVHSGLSANSGHYYSFCRSTSSNQLHLEDDPAAPWIKFNDMNVTTTNWSDMNACVESSVSDSVYLLFYKRLDNHGDDADATTHDEEAMLLAKAMSLSMSTHEIPAGGADAVLFAAQTTRLVDEIQRAHASFLLETVPRRSGPETLADWHEWLQSHHRIDDPQLWTAVAHAIRK